MGPWIDACKKEINSIVDCVRNQNFNIQVRVSVVAYRDFYDLPNISEVLPFTEDIAVCKRFIEKLTPLNGGDYPEDVVGGLENGLIQNWMAKTRFAVLIGDAPCHGKQYHDEVGLKVKYRDHYPNGDPRGRIIEN